MIAVLRQRMNSNRFWDRYPLGEYWEQQSAQYPNPMHLWTHCPDPRLMICLLSAMGYRESERLLDYGEELLNMFVKEGLLDDVIARIEYSLRSPEGREELLRSGSRDEVSNPVTSIVEYALGEYFKCVRIRMFAHELFQDPLAGRREEWSDAERERMIEVATMKATAETGKFADLLRRVIEDPRQCGVSYASVTIPL